jgi:hypothetical protein
MRDEHMSPAGLSHIYNVLGSSGLDEMSPRSLLPVVGYNENRDYRVPVAIEQQQHAREGPIALAMANGSRCAEGWTNRLSGRGRIEWLAGCFRGASGAVRGLVHGEKPPTPVRRVGVGVGLHGCTTNSDDTTPGTGATDK